MSEKQRILIVDDELSVLIVLKSSLKRLGDSYEVDVATSSEEALMELETRSYDDVVITDYQMDGMNGLQRYKQTVPNTPNDLLFSIQGQPLYSTAYKRLRAFSRSAGVPDVSPLQLRPHF